MKARVKNNDVNQKQESNKNYIKFTKIISCEGKSAGILVSSENKKAAMIPSESN